MNKEEEGCVYTYLSLVTYIRLLYCMCIYNQCIYWGIWYYEIGVSPNCSIEEYCLKLRFSFIIKQQLLYNPAYNDKHHVKCFPFLCM